MKNYFLSKYGRNIISLIFFCFSYYLYYISLEKCFSGIDVCGRDIRWIFRKAFKIVVSCFISSILLFLIYYKQLSKLHILHFIICFYLFYIFSHGYSFEDHGLLNFIGFFTVLTIIILFGIIIKGFILLIILIYKSHNIQKFSYVIMLSFFYYDITDPNNCIDWGKGLNNTFIENDLKIYGCQIKYPKSCTYKIFKYIQDLTKLYNIDCSISYKNNKDNIFKQSNSPFIYNNSKKIGFPLTNKGIIGRLDGVDDSILTKYVLDNLFDIENNTQNITEYELLLDFSKTDLGEYIIDLKFNESLSKERKLLENKNSPYSDNIMVLFIDSVSRGNSIRQLIKTLNFFEKFISYDGGFNPKYPDNKFHSFQFFKYHSFKYHTSGNFPRLFYGNVIEAKNIVLLTKYFKENGYITNYNSDSCQKDNTRTFHNLTELEVYDHQFLLCDPNVVHFITPFTRCLHGKTDAEHLYNYANQFWRKYINNRKFSMVILNDGHEGTLEALKYTDTIIYDYLISLFNDNLLKNTSIFLLSDHGVVMPSLYSLSDFYYLEMDLPMLYILVNDRKNSSYDQQYLYIHKNQQTFITAYDIYNTINHLLYGDQYINIKNKTEFIDTPKSPFGQSLFYDIEQNKRTSKKYKYMDHSVCI